MSRERKQTFLLQHFKEKTNHSNAQWAVSWSQMFTKKILSKFLWFTPRMVFLFPAKTYQNKMLIVGLISREWPYHNLKLRLPFSSLATCLNYDSHKKLERVKTEDHAPLAGSLTVASEETCSSNGRLTWAFKPARLKRSSFTITATKNLMTPT